MVMTAFCLVLRGQRWHLSSGTAFLAGSSESCAVQSHLGFPLALVVILGQHLLGGGLDQHLLLEGVLGLEDSLLGLLDDL